MTNLGCGKFGLPSIQVGLQLTLLVVSVYTDCKILNPCHDLLLYIQERQEKIHLFSKPLIKTRLPFCGNLNSFPISPMINFILV